MCRKASLGVAVAPPQQAAAKRNRAATWQTYMYLPDRWQRALRNRQNWTGLTTFTQILYIW